MRSSTITVLSLSIGLLTYACGSSDDDKAAPTCAELWTQLDACPQEKPANAKASFDSFCAVASEACLSCLDGHICGVTEQCDPQCGKSEDGGSLADGGSSADAANTGKAAPSCADLQTQLEACPNTSDAGTASFAALCAGASEACRSCLDGQLCGATEQCDAQCKK